MFEERSEDADDLEASESERTGTAVAAPIAATDAVTDQKKRYERNFWDGQMHAEEHMRIMLSTRDLSNCNCLACCRRRKEGPWAPAIQFDTAVPLHGGS